MAAAAPGADPFDLTGRVALVTGGSRGIGRCISAGLAQRGADVVIASRDQEACAVAASDIAAATGRKAVGIGCHVGQWVDCDHLVNAACAAFGRVDILVNNAGMSPLYESLPEVTEALFDKVLAVNLRGPFRLSSLLGKKMSEQGGGVIINVSSIAAVQPDIAALPYALAKAALNALTVGLAHALGPAVRVNGIMPGPILTDVSAWWDGPAFTRHAQTEIPLRRGGQPGELVGAAVYLASSAASYTTGAIIKVDGGAAWAPA
jgi:NAD(P)-dependent dehydrogenase (short-subunit alcohol dehydrogenase family)